jgi:tRNA pseudouridine55 synthase
MSKSRKRDIRGILLLDKPKNISSNEALQQAKRLFSAKKAGHTGSLDPLASGLLVICFGAATKITSYLLDASKEYIVRAKLGEKTETGDAEGDVIQTRPVENLTESRVESVVDQFRGEIEQVPPMYSALKHNGERLYSLARKGVEVERKPRKVTIYDLKVLEVEKDTVLMTVHCSKGTYIRTLVEDIGESLGCGAYTLDLKRVAVGPFSSERTFSTPDELKELKYQSFEELDAVLLPTEYALESFPKVEVSTDTAFFVKQGQAVQISNAPTSGMVRIFQRDAGFIGVGKVLSDGRITPKRLML